MLNAAETILAEKNFTIRPRYSIKRVERQPGVFEVWLLLTLTPARLCLLQASYVVLKLPCKRDMCKLQAASAACRTGIY